MNTLPKAKKPYEHTFNDKDVCTKCHQHRSEIKRIGRKELWNLCPVIGKEEVAHFRDYDER